MIHLQLHGTKTSARFLLSAALPVAALLLATGCGGSGDTPSTPEGETGGQAAAQVHDEHDGHEHGPDGDTHAASEAEKPSTDFAKAGTDLPKEAATKPNPAHGQPGHVHAANEAAQPAEKFLDDGNGPRLVYEIGKSEMDFGRVTQGEVLVHIYPLTAGGTEDLVITQVKATCGCTVAQVMVEDDSGEMQRYTYGDPIPPGRKIELPAKTKTKGKRGRQNVRITIFSNDPRGQRQLGMLVEIDPFFQVTPSFLNFGKLSIGETSTKTASIRTAKGQRIGLELQQTTAPAGGDIVLEALDPDEEGKATRWTLSVTLGPDLVEGNIGRTMTLKSDLLIPGMEATSKHAAPNYDTTVTVSAQVVGAFTHQPSYLSMGLVRPGQVVSRTVRIECNEPVATYDFSQHLPTWEIGGLPDPASPGQLREWEYKDSFTVNVCPVEGANAVDIEVTLEGLPDGVNGSFRGTMLVAIDHPTKKQIQLVITGVCRGGAKTRAAAPGRPASGK